MKKIITILVVLVFQKTCFSQDDFSLINENLTAVTETEKLSSLCKIWGFLKYYHPKVVKGHIDWDNELKGRIKTLTLLDSKEEINNFYIKWISDLGEIKPHHLNKYTIPDSLKFNLDLVWMTDSRIFTNELIQQLQFIVENKNTGKNHYVSQYPFIGNPKFKNEKAYKDSVYPSTELRLLSLSRYWNIINYFFPYKYRIGQDWNNVLTEMIPKFTNTKDTIEYHLAMRELVAKMNDSHAGLSTKYTKQYFGLKWAPFKFKIIDNKAIVTDYYNESLCKKNDILIGDVFFDVNNKAIANIIAENSKYISGSNESSKLRNFSYAVYNGSTDSVNVRFERNGIVKNKTIYRYQFEDFKYKWPTENKYGTYMVLDGNIGYVNLGLLKPKQVNKAMNSLNNTRAIIFDVRNYPNGTMYKIATFLNAEKKPFVKFTKPDISFPGIYHYTSPYYCGRQNKNHYKGKVVLLFNETTQSQAEFTLMALETAPNVIKVGSQTAGADGNVSLITLPGNYQTYISGIGVYYPNGKETQRVGIIPDIEVKPTIEGIKMRKDEVLEKAIAVINKK